MHNIHIIGNGFDLAHGMKTSYQDFLKDYLINILEGKPSPLTPETKILSTPLIENRQLETGTNSLKDIFNKINPITEASAFNSRNLTTNKTTVYFENKFILEVIKSNSIFNWVDVEQFYFESLYKIAKRIAPNQRSKELTILNQEFEVFKMLLISYLKTLPNPKQNLTLSELIRKNCQPSPNNSFHQDVFINFNYTNTFEQLYYQHVNTNAKLIINIHGNLKENNITFGHGDELSEKFKEIEDLNENDFLKNIKSFSYLTNSNYSKIQSLVDSGSFQVIIYGHSCGTSDRTLLNLIFESKGCAHIKTLYHKEKSTDNFNEILFNISRNFRDKNLMRRRVFDKTRCEIFPQLEQETTDLLR